MRAIEQVSGYGRDDSEEINDEVGVLQSG